MTKTDPVARFWSKVAKAGPDDCWLYLGRINEARGGYGVFDDENRKSWRAHRYAFFVTHGYAPPLIRHTCDRPACCNPNHLIEGTQQDNIDDMFVRGREVRGEQHGRAKLTEAAVITIRSSTASHTALARQHGVSRHTIELIRAGRNWPGIGQWPPAVPVDGRRKHA